MENTGNQDKNANLDQDTNTVSSGVSVLLTPVLYLAIAAVLLVTIAPSEAEMIYIYKTPQECQSVAIRIGSICENVFSPPEPSRSIRMSLLPGLFSEGSVNKPCNLSKGEDRQEVTIRMWEKYPACRHRYVVDHGVSTGNTSSWHGDTRCHELAQPIIADVCETGVRAKERRQEQEARQKEQKNIADEKAKIEEAIARRNPDDVIEQVLNYSSTGDDSGIVGDDGALFWYKVDTCKYARIQWIANSGLAMLFQLYGQPQINEVDLNKLDPMNLQVEQSREPLSTVLFGDAARGQYQTLTKILYEGRELIRTGKNVSTDRVRRGWELIYTKYCKGIKKEF